MKALIIYFLFYFSITACNDIDKFGGGPSVSNKPIDTIETAPSEVTALPHLFETAFIKGSTQIREMDTISLYGVNIGKLKVPTGTIIACDPMHIDEYGIPFTQVFPTGEFPVQVAVAKIKSEERIAFARISFSDAPVVKWAFALRRGDKEMPIGGEDRPGYSVDAGVGVFIDSASNKSLNRDYVTNMDTGIYLELEKNYRRVWRYAIFNFKDYNLATFSSGFGDGYYSSYIGFDANGKPCRLLTDFNVLDWNMKKR